MSAEPLSLALPAVGVFMDESPAAFTPQARAQAISFIHSATNLHINERRYRTRTLWKEIPLSGDTTFLTANIQGAIAYDPTTGANAFNSPSGGQGIVVSAAGKLYRIDQEGVVSDISSGIIGRPTVRLAWLAQGANYVIRTDEVSPTQIWNGSITVTSTGYDKNAPASSRLPNFAGPVVYSDRFWIVINGNEVIAGDHLHRISPTDNVDLLKTTDQSYDITSVSFSSPDQLGNVTSLNVVTSQRGGDLGAQGEVVAGTDKPGMWGILAGIPRAQWANRPTMRRVIHRTVGPSGPYASWTSTDELLLRSVEGMTSMKYAGAENNQPGNPYVNLGSEIKPLLDRDPADLLLYASVAVSARRQRLACTVYPVVDGAHRWHRAYVTAALSPGRTRVPEPMVWEGVSTLPAAMGEIIQFVEVKSDGRGAVRQLALLRKADGTNGLAEWTNQWGDDRLADGTTVRIPWQILTRKLAPHGEYSPASFGSVYLLLADIRDRVDIKVHARSSTKAAFKEVYSGTFTNEGWGSFEGGYAASDPICLGDILSGFRGQWIEMVIQGEGSCIVDAAIGSANGGNPNSKTSNKDVCLNPDSLCQFDIFKRA